MTIADQLDEGMQGKSKARHMYSVSISWSAYLGQYILVIRIDEAPRPLIILHAHFAQPVPKIKKIPVFRQMQEKSK